MKIVKKGLHIFLILAFLFSLLALSAFAEGEGSSAAAKERTDELLGEWSMILPEGLEGLADGEVAQDALGFESLLRGLVDALRGELPGALSFLLFLVGVTVLLSLVGSIGEAIGGAARPCAAVACGCALFVRLMPTFRDAVASLSDIGDFFSRLIPILTSAAALTGGKALAGVTGVGTSLTLSLVGGMCSLLLPLVVLMTALGILSSLHGSAALSATVRRVLMRAIGIITLVLGALFALQTTVAAASDGATLRAMKYAASGSIPVVGGTVSGALSALAGGLEYASTVIGGGGAAAILALALSPLLRLLLYRLAFFLAQLLIDALPSGEGSSVLGAVSGGLDMITAVYSLGVVVYLFEAVVVMKGIISVL